MATIKHDEARGTTWVKWRAGGRSGVDCSATFDTKGGARGANGWAAFASQLAAEGHPLAPSGWAKVGRRWVRRETIKGTTELLGSYGLRWIREEKRGDELSKVVAGERFLRHIEPVLGRVWLDELTAGDVERWQLGLESKLAPGSIKNLRSILRGIVRAAVRDGYADVDVTALTSRSKSGRKYQSKAIPLDELPLYLTAAHRVGGSFGDLVEIMLLTSVRIGELSALPTSALLHPTAKRPARLRIAASVKVRVVDGARDGREVGKVKTEASERIIELDDRAYRILKRRAAESKLRGELYLFPAATGGPLTATPIRNRWVQMLAIAAELGAEVPETRTSEGGYERLGVTPHGLRRTHISYRMSLGHDVASVARDVGHANASTTLNVYTDSVSSEAQRYEQMQQLGAIIGKAASNA